MKETDIKTFEMALQLLDRKLEEMNHSNVIIKAIGGFAMLFYGMREHGYTIDIDSLTEEYDDELKMVIKEVGKELNIDEEWLNTDCSTLEGFLTELEPNIHWETTKYNYKKIELYIADIYGLLESKIKAVHDGGLVPRATDKDDMLSILRLLNINNIEELDEKESLKYISNKYKRSYQYLTEIKEW